MLRWLCALGLLWVTAATPLSATFTSCLNEYSPVAPVNEQLVVSSVYANLVSPSDAHAQRLPGANNHVLRFDVFGSVQSEVIGYGNETNKLATLFTETTENGLSVFSSVTWLCDSLFPGNTSVASSADNSTFCLLAPGNFGLNMTVPLYRSYGLAAIRTQLRIVDTTDAANTLTCIEVEVTPYTPRAWYYRFLRWFPIAICIGFWLVTWAARFAAGWVVGSGVAEYEQKEGAARERKKARRVARMRQWGTMVVSGLSGERLSVSGSLLRFVTPNLRDIIYHLQWVTVLGMISVEWPDLAYTIFRTGAWVDLVGNITVIGTEPANVVPYPLTFTSPDNFDNRVSDPSSPLYLDQNQFNPLLDLQGASSGMQSFATACGLHDTELFGTCMVIFCALAAAVLVLSFVTWLLHAGSELLTAPAPSASPNRSSMMSTGSQSINGLATTEGKGFGTEGSLGTLPTQASILATQANRGSRISRLRRVWFRFRPRGEAGAFHAAAVYGNLLRLLLLFHLPVTTFSIYQLAVGGRASTVSRVLAALAFAFLSVAAPTFIMWKIRKTPSGKLYDATRTLLALGPMYNVYVEGKHMFRCVPLAASLVIGIAVGAGQRSGLAQSIVVVVVELIMLLVSPLWYPWGEGASMGALTAFLGIVRLASAVLTMLLSDTLDLSPNTDLWLMYSIFLLQAIVFAVLGFMLIVKVIEGFTRLSGGVLFDESKHPLDGGLLSAIMDLDCFNGARGGKAAARRRRKHGSRQLQRNVSAVGSLTTQMMLDRHSQGVSRPSAPISEGTTPFLSPSSQKMNEHGYFPSYQPPLGPPPTMERQSSDGHTEETGHGNIMDAWRPYGHAGYGQVNTHFPVGTGQPGPSSPRGVTFGSTMSTPSSPYAPGGPGGSYFSPAGYPQFGHAPPGHSRQPSSEAMRFPYGDASTASGHPNISANPNMQRGVRPNNEGLLPPPLVIPHRRSLNNLKDEPSPKEVESPSPDSPSRAGKKATRRSGPGGWFTRSQDAGTSSSDAGSDSDAGPTRREARASIRPTRQQEAFVEPKPFDPVPRVAGEPSKKVLFGLLKRKTSLDEFAKQARDENMARKAALATRSGAMFAGVEAPKAQGANKGFAVKRKDEATVRPGPRVLSPSSPQGPQARDARPSSIANPTPDGTSFKVQRKSQVPAASSSVPLAPPALDLSQAVSNPPVAEAPMRSFRVIRREQGNGQSPSPTTTGLGSFVVNRGASQVPSAVAAHPISPEMGYSSDAFVPIDFSRAGSTGT